MLMGSNAKVRATMAIRTAYTTVFAVSIQPPDCSLRLIGLVASIACLRELPAGGSAAAGGYSNKAPGSLAFRSPGGAAYRHMILRAIAIAGAHSFLIVE